MEEHNEKMNGFNYVKWIVIAIVAFIFIGIKVYTKYLERQTRETLNQIIEKNPDVLTNITNESN